MLLLLLFLFQIGLALEIKFEKVPIEISQEQRQLWRQVLYSDKEAWVIQNLEDFYSLFEGNPRALEFATRTIKKQITSSELQVSLSYFKIETPIPEKKNLVILYLTPEEKREYFSGKLNDIYSYFYSKEKIYHKNFESGIKKYLDNFLQENIVNIDYVSFYQSSIFEGKNGFNLPITPDLWQALSDKGKDELIDHEVKQTKFFNPSFNKLIARIEKISDIDELVKLYILPPYQYDLELQLKKFFLQNEGKAFNVPLHRIISPFVAKQSYTLGDYRGGNCLNSALCFGDNDSEQIHFSKKNAFVKDLNQHYNEIPSEHAILGDIIVYYNQNDYPTHASNFINENFSFNKIGMARNSPYNFLQHHEVEAIYFPNKNFTKKFFRKKNTNESALYKALCFVAQFL